MTEDVFAVERAHYASIKLDLVRSEGKFALIKGKELIGTYDTPRAAYEDGLRKLGNVPMFIVRIQKQDAQVWIPALNLGLIRGTLQS